VRRAAAAVACGAALAAAGCGGGGGGGGGGPAPTATTAASSPTAGGHGVAWSGKPLVFRARNLPSDRVVIAHVRNAGHHTLQILAADVKVRDAAGHALRSSAGFTNNFAHGLFGAFQQPRRLPPAELLRLGKMILLQAGSTAPFFAAWRVTRHTKLPVHVDLGRGGTLVLPGPNATTAR